MGVYIKGMKMPKDREIYLRIDEKGEVYVYGSYPTELYKAVPVPQHGRLIDADELLSSLAHNLGIRSLEYLTSQERAIVSWIDAAPTIIPASEEAKE